MLDFYQNLPHLINPVAFSIGFFSIRWYSIMYLIGFAAVYRILCYRTVNDENFLSIPNQIQNSKVEIKNLILDWIIYAVGGLLIGARLGYVLFYNPGYYFNDPLAVVSPYDFSSGSWTGIFGMSYFGGAAGIFLASLIFCRRRGITFQSWADFIIPAVPAGYFFGRIGNFLNGELYGRITQGAWGMYFPADTERALRHPSQLYEAFFEGLVLFLVLWHWRNRAKFPGQLLAAYLLGYGLLRFGIEFFREPDPGDIRLWGWFTAGQLFSLAFIVLAAVLGGTLWKRKKDV